jgi:hypothetical protein
MRGMLALVAVLRVMFSLRFFLSSLPLSPLDRMDALASLDEDIAALANDALEERRAIGTRQNELTPLGRLPEDVLIEIAGLLMLTGMDRSSSEQPEYNLSRVCTSVRGVIVAAPVLWSYINLNYSVRWCRLCVGRARSTTLFLSYHQRPFHADMPGWTREQYAQRESLFVQLLPRAAHVRAILSPGSSDTDGKTLVDALLTTSRPLVRSLEFGTTIKYALPVLDLRGFTALTTLTCTNPWYPVQNFHLPSLENLEIWRSYEQGRSTELSDIANLIRAAPNLRVLVVCDGQSDYKTEETALESLSAVLPHLEDVCLMINTTPVYVSRCPIPELVTLFQALPVPRQKCTIIFGQAWRDDDNCAARASALQAILRDGDVLLNIQPQGHKYKVSFAEIRDGTWLFVEHAADFSRAFTYLESAPPCVRTLLVGKNMAPYVFRRAIGKRMLFAAVMCVIVEDEQRDYGHLKQWMHARVGAGRRLHILQFRGAASTPLEMWAVQNMLHDVVQLRLAEVVILANGTQIRTDSALEAHLAVE